MSCPHGVGHFYIHTWCAYSEEIFIKLEKNNKVFCTKNLELACNYTIFAKEMSKEAEG